jgi:hypothetical protein
MKCGARYSMVDMWWCNECQEAFWSVEASIVIRCPQEVMRRRLAAVRARVADALNQPDGKELVQLVKGRSTFTQ